jgi:hypothetical protein
MSNVDGTRPSPIRLDCWKEQIERRASLNLAGDAYVAADAAHKVADLRDAQTGPPFPLCRKEGLENVLKDLIEHAHAIIPDPNANIVARCGVRDAAVDHPIRLC